MAEQKLVFDRYIQRYVLIDEDAQKKQFDQSKATIERHFPNKEEQKNDKSQ